MDAEQPLPPLARLVRSMPQEIFDIIYLHTFQTPPTEALDLQLTTKSPSLLQLSQSTRLTYAKTYFPNLEITVSDLQVLRKWVLALQPQHLKLITNISYLLTMPPYGTGSYAAYLSSKKDGFKELWKFEAEMEKELPKGLALPEIQVKFRVDESKPSWVGKGDHVAALMARLDM
ncbi:hypothetical protein HII31_04753 [Pseudocercospora fuligena]|uniref:Uncharacterized protein n=1 Tax=Pseudocercospora fuligena TaxID=685502 RepID=A0A8H6RMJ7_9PEZI|nr:hypothetical protein HII31_04753 [Pseudocercospora fuligena]